MRERSEKASSGDEFMFFDTSDDLEEALVDSSDSSDAVRREYLLESNNHCGSGVSVPNGLGGITPSTPSSVLSQPVEVPQISELLSFSQENNNVPESLRGVHALGLGLMNW